jgi:ParE toxin of type II toxin-antitoxin system, parDE
VTPPLRIEASELARELIREADSWWRSNRPKAPNAVREEVERASSLISVQPNVGTLARNITLPNVRRLGMRRIRYDLYYRVAGCPEYIEVLALWHWRRESGPPIQFGWSGARLA